jgi:5-methyltetrahydrofolate--homocysteine methyltransferase
MALCVQELAHRGLQYPVLIGGAAINREFGRRVALPDGKTPYGPGVFYCKDAFEGLEVMDGLQDPHRRAALVARAHADAQTPAQPAAQSVAPRLAAAPVIRTVEPAPAPVPPFWGCRSLDDIDLSRVFKHLALRSLFRLSWGAKNTNGPEWTRLLKDDFMPRLRRLQREAVADGWMRGRAVYGYFPCYAEGDDLVVLSPDDHSSPIERFSFPRQSDEQHLCISDYFASDRARPDVVAFQLVTVGEEATAHADALREAGRYADAYYAHGLSVETAEALAEYVHRRIRGELGLQPGQGKRYSWGYPACPDLSDHTKVFRLLPTGDIGVTLTTAYQLVPEQSTVAIVAHHPTARYFSVRASRFDVAV